MTTIVQRLVLATATAAAVCVSVPFVFGCADSPPSETITDTDALPQPAALPPGIQEDIDKLRKMPATGQ
jgi:hypothetical protein